ncbi:2-oxo acid dehydrogenase subunit E2 [Candidatus Pelagibacter sp. HIMB109]|uniref:2-oxo acid dehydrogenase subunit E2 n=1 Tax=Candidatus Pelagibacter sp. HIMB109 TaxID=3415412 RepID=UPI003F87AA8A
MSEIVKVPNIGDFKNVEIIEVLVKEGDEINKGDPIITLESDKSSVEVPSSFSGKISNIKIKIGDKVSEGDQILEITTNEKSSSEQIQKEQKTNKEIFKKEEVRQTNITEQINLSDSTGASPNTLKFARELGININELQGSGRGGRVKKEDIKNFVKNRNVVPQSNDTKISDKVDLPYEHSEFGPVDIQKIPRIKRLSGPHLVKAWNSIPHVTQHDEIDVTEMENFRKGLVDLNTREKIPVTPLAFIMKALVNAMKKYPNFNSSLDPENEEVVYKKYFHIGIAVDTPHGLMVPKIRNVDQKDILTLGKELRKVSKQCKELKIDKKEFFGGSMTISSLGGIGGSFFTPIVNLPEVCILGIGKTETKQVYIDGKFLPRKMMPISLSYDHRMIDGAEAARFCQDLKISLGRNFAFKLAS